MSPQAELPWRDISYLATGTESQRAAYAALRELGVLEALSPFDPVLASTVCTDIDLPGSDLDILCRLDREGQWEKVVRANYGGFDRFALRAAEHASPAAKVASFLFAGWEFEIFAQDLPVERQNGYRHMCQTARALALGGDVLRPALRELKRRGMKTEPALAKLLRLDGDPYRAVLDLEARSDPELAELIRNMRGGR